VKFLRNFTLKRGKERKEGKERKAKKGNKENSTVGTKDS
jgi:hypothetical protein